MAVILQSDRSDSEGDVAIATDYGDVRTGR